SPVTAYLFHPVAGGGDGVGSDPGAGRACLDRVDADLSASGQRLAGAGVLACCRCDRRAGGPGRGQRAVNGAPARQHDDVQALVEAYRGDLIAVGMFAQKPVTSTARSFLLEIGVEGWGALSLAEQCALPPKYRRVVSWLIVTGRVRPTPDYLVVCRPHVGEVAAHLQPA